MIQTMTVCGISETALPVKTTVSSKLPGRSIHWNELWHRWSPFWISEDRCHAIKKGWATRYPTNHKYRECTNHSQMKVQPIGFRQNARPAHWNGNRPVIVYKCNWSQYSQACEVKHQGIIAAGKPGSETTAPVVPEETPQPMRLQNRSQCPRDSRETERERNFPGKRLEVDSRTTTTEKVRHKESRSRCWNRRDECRNLKQTFSEEESKSKMIKHIVMQWTYVILRNFFFCKTGVGMHLHP